MWYNNMLAEEKQNFYHIETSQLIYRANQSTGFYMMATSAFNELIAICFFPPQLHSSSAVLKVISGKF